MLLKRICLMVIFVLFSANVYALGAFEGNSKKLANEYPEQYNSWFGSVMSSEEPDRNAPNNAAQTIILGMYYNYKDVIYGKRSHANSSFEAYWSVGGDGSYYQQCMPCHSSDSPGLFNKYGEDNVYQGKFSVLMESANPIGCANCHNTETMELRVGNPFAVRAIEKIGKDPKKLSQNELRSYVCTQCHFEYISPIKNGVKTIEMDWGLYGDLETLSKYYDEQMAPSFTHPISKAPVVRPMNNEAGLAMNGTHFKHGVSCADCHMPEITVKGNSFTSHDNVMGSRDIKAACQSCHKDQTIKRLEKDLKARMDEYGGINVRKLEKALAETHLLIGEAVKLGATNKQLATIYKDVRASQWRWDYLLWQKGGAFHAGFETQQLLATALNKIDTAKTDTFLLLAKLGAKNISIPDFSTVEKAAKILGLQYPPAKAQPVDNSYLKMPLSNAVKDGLLNEDIYNHGLKKNFQ